MPETLIASFVLRFVTDQEKDSSQPAWHGVIRHIQTNEQLNFTGMGEALGFIQKYFNIQPSEQVPPLAFEE